MPNVTTGIAARSGRAHVRLLRFISLLALMLGCAAGCQSFRSAFELLSGDTAARAVQRMEDPTFPDERREGIVYLADHDYARKPPYTTRFAQIARNDPDYTVRAMAIRALNIARDKSATGVFIAALADPQWLVRLEAAKALANVPDPQAMPPLLNLLSEPAENADVRIAAADALKHYQTIEVGRALVSALQDRNFGVSWQARQSLVRLTHRDLGYDQGKWLNYLTGAQRPFA